MKFSRFIIPEDKANHVVYGAAVAACALVLMSVALFIASSLGLQVAIQRAWLVAAAMAITTAAAWWKEWMHDASRPSTNTVDKRDFLATVTGGLLVCLPVIFMELNK